MSGAGYESKAGTEADAGRAAGDQAAIGQATINQANSQTINNSLDAKDELIVVGRVTAAFGIKGWVKVLSHTAPNEGILNYNPWFIKHDDGTWNRVKLADSKRQGKLLLVRFKGCEDRNQALTYCQQDIAVKQEQLAQLDEGEYYWHQLEGLTVKVAEQSNDPLVLGKVDYMMATGANDVMVVKPSADSLDERERLLPYLIGQVVERVDLEDGVIWVDWDADF